MALLGDCFYVGATDGVFVFGYRSGQTKLEGPGKKILDLPAGGYNKITPEAWAQWDEANEAYQQQLRRRT